MKNFIKSVRGMRDIVPPTTSLFRHIENVATELSLSSGYLQIRTPVLESAELFQRGVGASTDIVNKEMYTFVDKGDNHLTLRPEGTASVVRAAIENSLIDQQGMCKLFYLGSMYRRERPQKGRYREFYQYGLEAIGFKNPMADVEIISMGFEFLKKLGLKDVEVRISSLGNAICRKPYLKKLSLILEKNLELIPKDFVQRIKTNPQRIFDYKDDKLKEFVKTLPNLLDNLDKESLEHFDRVKKGLSDVGVPFVIDPNIVRGLDYYCHTAFEYIPKDSNSSQSSLGGGGRYDGLVEELGGKPTSAVGLAMGLDRIALLMDDLQDNLPLIYVAFEHDSFSSKALNLAVNIRCPGVVVECELEGRSLKGQMKRAGKLGAKFVIIVGEGYSLRDMNSGEQSDVNLDHLKNLKDWI